MDIIRLLTQTLRAILYHAPSELKNNDNSKLAALHSYQSDLLYRLDLHSRRSDECVTTNLVRVGFEHKQAGLCDFLFSHFFS